MAASATEAFLIENVLTLTGPDAVSYLQDAVNRSAAVRGVEARTVTSMEVVNGSMSGGFTGRTAKIVISWADGETTNAVVKTTQLNANSFELARTMSITREVRFYETLSKALPEGAGVPRIIAADEAANGYYLICMEDLTALGAANGNHLMGNQCWGAVKLPESFDSLVADPVPFVKVVFRVHNAITARFWRDPLVLKEYDWLKGTEWFRGEGRDSWERCPAAMRRIYKRLIDGVTDGTRKLSLAPSFREAMEAHLEGTSWDSYQAQVVRPVTEGGAAFSLTHGDFHAGNVFLTPDLSVFLLDWAEVGIGCPITDLAQFLISNATPAMRRANEAAMLDEYHDMLAAKGCAIDKEELRARYRRGGIERWLQLATYMAALPNFPEFGAQWYIDQTQAFIDDHWEALKASGAPLLLRTAYSLPE